MRVAALLLPVALIACGSGESADVAFRENVAHRFDAECRRTDAPTAEAARQLQYLCSCVGRRIRASDIAFGDGPDAISAQEDRLSEDCMRELYGNMPGDGNEVP